MDLTNAFFLPESAGVQLHNIFQILHRIIHSFNGNVFAWSVEGIAAGSKVRTGQSHEGKSCAICAAADCNCLRIQPGLLDGFLGVIDQVHARLDLLFHVAVLFFDDEGYGTFAVFLVEKLDDMSHQLLAAGEHGAVVVTDNVVKACRRHISAHFTEMEKIPHTLLCSLGYLLPEACY